MSDLLSAYSALLTSKEQLIYCQQAETFEETLVRLKQVLQKEELSNKTFIGELNQCNQQLLNIDVGKLAGSWLPYRYNAKTQCVYWCLPMGKPEDPFHDQYIERCRQQVTLNQLLQPRSSLASLEAWEPETPVQPAAFIFHLSRCGSTLLSGCLSELEGTVMLSESSLLTEFLLDKSLPQNRQHTLLPKLITLQGGAQAKVIIKWNAWDIFNWPLLHTLYPEVPTIFVVRNPREILASHQSLVGRHMSGDPSLTSLHSVFSYSQRYKTLLDFRINVLKKLMDAMVDAKLKAANDKLILVDYTQLTETKIFALADACRLSASPQTKFDIRARMHVHSKDRQRPFQPDHQQKEQAFNVSERNKIERELSPVYQQLLTITPKVVSEPHILVSRANLFSRIAVKVLKCVLNSKSLLNLKSLSR